MILAIALSVVAVKLTSKMPETALKAATRTLLADMRYASQLASSKGKDIKLTVDISALSYTLNGKTRKFPENTAIVIKDTEDRLLRNGSWHVVFYAGGGSTGGEIKLSIRKKAFKITIDPIAGAMLTKS